jgi:hypothetical protein
MRTRWNSQSLSEYFIEFLRALRETDLSGKWPESEDDSTDTGTL